MVLLIQNYRVGRMPETIKEYMKDKGFNMMEKFYFDEKSGNEPFFVAVYRFTGADYNPGKFKLLLGAKENEEAVPEQLAIPNFFLGPFGEDYTKIVSLFYKPADQEIPQLKITYEKKKEGNEE